MKLQLIARHIRDDQDNILELDDDVVALLERMKLEIEENKSEGSNWRFAITPTKEAYQ
ncbi:MULTISPECIES: hypothetical protein [unclassified Mesorhizobium]|uniref:hypothetical protein n=1 Tax=unclassified Mesorhizobium TaxID=325217 RepID=UPI0015E43DF8|nr:MULTISPECIES: hypothetical protein [unclassified Mesorhizobium]